MVVGAGLSGCEAALLLAQQKKQVDIIDLLPHDKLGAGGATINNIELFRQMDENGVVLHANTKLVDVTDDKVVVERKGVIEERTYDDDCDRVGVKPDLDEVNKFYGTAIEKIIVGDCSTTRGNLLHAYATAFDAAMRINQRTCSLLLKTSSGITGES